MAVAVEWTIWERRGNWDKMAIRGSGRRGLLGRAGAWVAAAMVRILIMRNYWRVISKCCCCRGSRGRCRCSRMLRLSSPCKRIKSGAVVRKVPGSISCRACKSKYQKPPITTTPLTALNTNRNQQRWLGIIEIIKLRDSWEVRSVIMLSGIIGLKLRTKSTNQSVAARCHIEILRKNSSWSRWGCQLATRTNTVVPDRTSQQVL